MGRPPVPIDWDQVDKLLAIQCTAAEVSAFFNCTTDALSDHTQRKHGTTFSEYARPKRLLGHASLRRKQYEQAMKGNTTLLLLSLIHI